MPHRHVLRLHLAPSEQGRSCQHMQTISLVTLSLGASSRANVKCLITLCNEHHCIRVDNIQHTHDSEFVRRMSQGLIRASMAYHELIKFVVIMEYNV